MSVSLVKRQKSRRSVAALAFLSNISLDGTHSDTNLSIFSKDTETTTVENRQKVECNSGISCIDENVLSADFDIDSQNKLIDDSNVLEDKNEYSDEENMSPFSIIHPDQDLRSISLNRSISPNTFVRRTSVTADSREQYFQPRKVFGISPAENISLGFDSTENIDARCRKRSGSVSDSSGSASGHDPRILKVTSSDRIRDERIVLVSKETNSPFMIYSSIPYYSHKRPWSRDLRHDLHSTGRKRHVSTGPPRPLSTISDGLNPFDIINIDRPYLDQEISYEKLLVPSRTSLSHKRINKDVVSDRLLHAVQGHINPPVYHRFFSHDPTADRLSPPPIPEKGAEVEDIYNFTHQATCCTLNYTPNLLDDPELVAGKHRTLLTFSSYVFFYSQTSVMDYVRPTDLKKELNDKFKDRFPHIQLTLTKLRSLKREMKKAMVSECGTELLTVAQSYVYFEKLVLKGFIHKHNRKVCAGTCMLLAAKLNDTKGNELKNQIEKLETVFRLSRKELIDSEFPVLVALEFSLHVPVWEIFPHYQRLIYV